MERLPLRNLFARMRRQKEEHLPGEQWATKDATILIVDDSRTMVHALTVFLERSGYRTQVAVDGVEAIQAAISQKPDLILMDIVMPRMNGFEATRKLTHHHETAAIPIIIVSGSNQPTDRVWGMRMGAKGYIAKPIKKNELLAAISSALVESRRAQRQKTLSRAVVSLDTHSIGSQGVG